MKGSFFPRLRRGVRNLPNGLIQLCFLSLLFFLAYLDYATSRFIQLSLFYALISALVGWTLGKRAVCVVVILSTCLAFLSDRLADPSVALPLDIANHGFRALLWTLTGLSLASLRKRMNLLDEAYEQIRRDVDAGRKVQMAFLSRTLPDDERVDIAVQFRTARELGGDYFDVRVIDDKLQVLVADVSGKGAPAALVTGLLGGIFSELSRRYHEPAKVLRILDKEIAPSLLEGMFITTFFLVMNMDTGECTYASAGHDPQYWVRESEVKELYPTGLPVGLLEGQELNTESFQIKLDEKVVFFTDGILNLKLADGTRLGEEPLLAFTRQTKSLDSRATSERIFLFLDEQGVLDDDALVLVLKRRPTPQRAKFQNFHKGGEVEEFYSSL
jgi:stage II sporulation SpoE-like protein